MPRQASIHDLPPALLELCWAPLSLCERHRAIPLVCSTWRRQLNSSPQLLQTCKVQLAAQPSPNRLRSFFEWVLRWGASHVRQLDLDVEVAAEAVEGEYEEFSATLAALLCACGTAGALQDLRLRHTTNAKTTAWLAAVRQLSVLHITADDSTGYRDPHLEFDPPKWSLASLRELWLSAVYVTIPPTAHLPATLTQLSIDGLQGRSDPLPAQIAGLSRLSELRLAWADAEPDGYAPLAALSSLRRLVLENCLYPPACLPQLTQLQALAFIDQGEDEESAAILQEALPALAGQLTCLALPGLIFGPAPLAPPSVLTACHGLQALFLMAGASVVIAELPPGLAEIAALPPGLALASLRYLSGPLGLLARSLGSLQAATRLEFVGVVCFSPDLAQLHTLLRWAAWHPTLRHLPLEGKEEELNGHFHRVSDAQRHNPNLRITRHHRTILASNHSQFLADCGFDSFYNRCAS